MNPSRSQLLAPIPTLTEQSWHLLTVLIRLGRAARPSELASPDLVELLCRIPGSPLFLTDDHFVTVSESAFAAFCGFFAGAVATPVPRLVFRARGWEEPRLMYTRKRKPWLSDGVLVGPRAKRILLLHPEHGEEKLRRDGPRIGNSPVKAWELQSSVGGFIAKDRLSVGTSSMVSNRGIALTPSLNSPNVLQSIFGSRIKGLVRRDGDLEKMCNGRQAMVLHKELPTLSGYEYGPLKFELNTAISEAVTTTRPKMNEADTGLSLLDAAMDKPILWMETIGEDSCILSAAPVAVRHEEVSTTNFLKDDNKTNMPSIDNGIHIGNTAGPEESKVATEANHCQYEGTSTAVSLSAEPITEVKHLTMSLEKPTVMDGTVSNVGIQLSVGEFKYRENDNFPRLEQAIKGEKCTTTKQKMKTDHINMPIKENRKYDISRISKSNSESKLLPDFESFVIEEEEGSGGYGTVYRARRKEDGKIFAVKYPHPNAHSHHVHNELKMLERFGGRNFVIKYEGSFKNGHSECFVLEHVEHDRPEVLKKEIDVFGLQWYGYCMFRALTSLHTQGVVHRDVKPGNFLFSRKLKKGYLIDFNLASDLHQKYSRKSRSRTSNVNLDKISVSSSRSALLTQGRKLGSDVTLNSIGKEAANDSRKLVLKHMKKKAGKGHGEALPNVDGSSMFGSQVADSGVTSAKDPTSTRSQSADRLKQPMPYKGRKELMNFVHEAMQSPSHKAVSGPTSQRKRVAAPLEKISKRFTILTPMPLHSGGDVVAGAGMFNGGNGKHKREGPCAGTKGFRAPEVLFKSSHQGFKVDVWSAGVTLLYLIIGKTPFGGDPEQNIKEIAKLRGSEDIWEVAKLHNRESSYPADLFDVQSLQSTELRDWCAMNTRRPDFLEQVPQSLFNLVDRCLTVNPRLRITAEEALMHNFFTPCHESLRTQRLLRIVGSESGSHVL